MNNYEILKNYDLFNNLSIATFTMVNENLREESFVKGTTIFNEGEIGDKIFFIVQGSVSISVENKQGQDIILSSLCAGEFFGEMAMLTHSSRTATAIAASDCVLSYMQKHEFDQLLENHQVMAVELSRVLSQRLISTNRIITHKVTNELILFIGADANIDKTNIFLDYFEKITAKKIIILDESMDIEQELQRVNNCFLIVKCKVITPQIRALAQHIISFQDLQETGIYSLKSSCMLVDLQRVARSIAKKTIGIALSSGTAPGLAHVGVMKVLTENNIPLDFIAGTSGGSLYGAPFAFNLNYDAIYTAFEQVYKKPLYQLWDPSLSISGIFKGNKLLLKTIHKLLGKKNIEETYIPFAAVSTNLYTGKEEIISTGDLMNAIRASLSIPIMFTPVRHKNKLLVDGVVTTPVPISALEKNNIHIKIAVYVSELNKFENKHPNLLNVFLRARNISSDFIADASVERADVIIKPKVHHLKQFEYNRIDDIIKAGEEAALQALPRIKKLLQA